MVWLQPANMATATRIFLPLIFILASDTQVRMVSRGYSLIEASPFAQGAHYETTLPSAVPVRGCKMLL